MRRGGGHSPRAGPPALGGGGCGDLQRWFAGTVTCSGLLELCAELGAKLELILRSGRGTAPDAGPGGLAGLGMSFLIASYWGQELLRA